VHVPETARHACRYNRNVIRPTLISAGMVCVLLLGGCKKDIQNQEAVRQGVMNYLSKRSDLLAMDVNVSSVSFHQDEATATVHFQAKGNPSAAAGMTMAYVLEKKDGQWVVKGRTGSNASHGADAVPAPGGPGSGSLGAMPNLPGAGGAGTALPPGHPGVGSGEALPPGHPTVGDGQSLPPGHPAVPSGQNGQPK
jgi:hypothetical protein